MVCCLGWHCKAEDPLHCTAVPKSRQNCGNFSDKLYEKNPAYTTTDDLSGLTPLHTAVLGGQYEIVQFLISTLKKDERNPAADNGVTPAHFAAERGMIDILDLLLPDLENKNPEANGGVTLLHYAANYSIIVLTTGVPTIKYLSKFVKDPNPPDRAGLTPMHYAVIEDKFSIVQHYLDTLPFGKKNPMENNDQKFTPLHYATTEGHLHLVRIISYELADKNPMGGHDITPLHLAVNLNSGNGAVSIQGTGAYGGHKVFGKLEIVKFIVEALNRSEINTPADDFFDGLSIGDGKRKVKWQVDDDLLLFLQIKDKLFLLKKIFILNVKTCPRHTLPILACLCDCPSDYDWRRWSTKWLTRRRH